MELSNAAKQTQIEQIATGDIDSVKKTSSISSVSDEDLVNVVNVMSPLEENSSESEDVDNGSEQNATASSGFLNFRLKLKDKSGSPGSPPSKSPTSSLTNTKAGAGSSKLSPNASSVNTAAASTSSSGHLFGSFTSDFIKKISMRSSGNDIAKSSSNSSLNGTGTSEGTASPKIPPKSILKKRSPLLESTSNIDLSKDTLDVSNKDSSHTASPLLVLNDQILGTDETEPNNLKLQLKDNPVQAEDGGTLSLQTRSTIMSSSLPNLEDGRSATQEENKTTEGSTQRPLGSLRNLSASSQGLRKSGSSKSLSFNLENVTVFHVPTKAVYNREPDKNATYRRLTPKLKDEIRAELNKYKSTEMEIHSESSGNTAFH